jgi:hypothetical protein
METKWAIVSLAALLVAVAQQCESNVFDLELELLAASPLKERLQDALMKLGVEFEMEPDELAAKIQKAAEAQAGNELANYRDIFQPLSSAIQNHEDESCPDELINLVEALLRLRKADLPNWWTLTPIKRFLKERILPKLKKCVSILVSTYADREELDVLEPLEGFIEAAYGPDWLTKLPEFTFVWNYLELNVTSAINFIKKIHLAGFDERRHPAHKIKEFLDDKCERIQAFSDVAVIHLMNVINDEESPTWNPIPEAPSELPEKLLKVENYYRICARWRSHNRWARYVIKDTAHKYDLMQGLPSAISLEKQRVLERERRLEERERRKKEDTERRERERKEKEEIERKKPKRAAKIRDRLLKWPRLGSASPVDSSRSAIH